MTKSSDFRTGRHCTFLMHAHLVFVTKYQRLVFTKEILNELQAIFKDVCDDFECELVEFEGERDHVHMLVHFPRKVALSKLVNSLKGVSSRLLRKRNFPTIRKALWGSNLWSPSYFAGSCGGAPLEVVKKYIEGQKSPRRP